ncbi:UNVERIFIED_CONTAM: hypothetical protein RMT77_005346 [Armadillidium vulgare]
MGTQMKLYEREKKVLKLEEECLRSLIFQYQSALNALKVEELTLANRLGQSLDRARKSQANTPTASMNPRSPSNLPILITKINTSGEVYQPTPLSLANNQMLEITTRPTINMNGNFQEEEEKEDEH